MDGLLAEMPGSVLAEWMAFDQVEPLNGARVNELQMADLLALTANVHRNPRVKVEPFERADFLVTKRRMVEEPVTAEAQLRMLKTWARFNQGGDS